MSLISKAFSDIITFSRSSNATRVGPDGKVAYAPHNLMQRSQEFDNAYWTAVDASITANAIAAPDGTVTADKLIASAISSSGHRVAGSCGNPAATWTVSIYAKAGEYNRLLMATSNTGFIGFNLSTGAVEGSIGLLITHYGITPVGNGWYRCYFGSSSTAAGTNLGIYPFNAAFSGSTTFTGDGTSGIYIWGAQSSQGVIPGDYTPTTSAAVYGPRFDYDPVTLAAKGLLIEEQRTNLQTYSEDFTNAAWTATAATVSANAATAPDGTSTADILTDNVSSDTHRVYQISTTTAAAYTASVFAKAGTRSWIYIRIQDSGGAGRHVWFNLATGTVGTTETGMTAAIQAAGNGWYRCAATVATAIAGATNQVVVIGMSTGDAVSIYAGGSGTVSLWGAQLEAGAFATSYIPTVASTVTRSADVASVNTLSPWYNGTEGTIFTTARSIADGAKGSFAAVEISNGSFNKRLLHGVSGSVYRTYYQDPIITLNSSATTTASSDIKMATGFNSSGVALSVNGNSVVSASAWTDSSAVTVLNIANLYGGSYGNCWVKRIAFYPRKLTNAELQTLTA